MNYGLYVSASGVLTNMYRQDVFANNLANVETAGFKPDVPAIRQRDPEVIEDQLGGELSQRLLDRLGGGVLAGPQRIDFTPGPLQKTGNPLDVALHEPDQFFAVRVTGPNGKEQVQLTRDGRFTRNGQGELVMPDGHRVLDVDDQPIVVPGDAPVTIDPVGRVIQHGEEIARLQVARIEEPGRLTKQGGNRFAFAGSDPRQVLDNPTVQPGFVESSGVDPITALMNLIASTKAVSGNAEMLRYHDMLMDRAVNTLGRVA